MTAKDVQIRKEIKKLNNEKKGTPPAKAVIIKPPEFQILVDEPTIDALRFISIQLGRGNSIYSELVQFLVNHYLGRKSRAK